MTWQRDAARSWLKAAVVSPVRGEYHNDRGAVYFKMGLLEQAERDYLAAIELGPPYPEVWTNLGQCYRAMERIEEAIHAYTRALDLDPDSTLALVGRADAQFALDHAELAALADYDRALTIEPEQPLVLGLSTNLGFCPDAEDRGRPLKFCSGPTDYITEGLSATNFVANP